MAKNIIELEKQLLLLEIKKEEQVKQLKADFSNLVDAMKPANIIKRGFSELIGGDKSASVNPLVGGIASFAGTFLLEEFLFKRTGFFYRVLTSVLASGMFQDLVKGEDSLQFTSSNEDVNLNPIYSFAQQIFNQTSSFHLQSINIAKHLFECTNHPNIKDGDLYVAYISNVKLGDEMCDAVGQKHHIGRMIFYKLKLVLTITTIPEIF